MEILLGHFFCMISVVSLSYIVPSWGVKIVYSLRVVYAEACVCYLYIAFLSMCNTPACVSAVFLFLKYAYCSAVSILVAWQYLCSYDCSICILSPLNVCVCVFYSPSEQAGGDD